MSLRVGGRIGPVRVSAAVPGSRTVAAAAGDAATGTVALALLALAASATGVGLVTVVSFVAWRILTYPLVAAGLFKRRVDLGTGLFHAAVLGLQIIGGAFLLALAAGALGVLAFFAVLLWSMGWFGLLVLFMAVIGALGAAAK